MTKSKLPKPLAFKIKAIEILESNLHKTNVPIEGDTVFQYDISLEQRIGLKECLMNVICGVEIWTEIRDQQLASLKTGFIYTVENLESYWDKKSGKPILPEDFRVSLNSVALSTSRGILFSFLKGTYLHSAILPVVNPYAFKIENLD
jgi:hypothetical protein